jgi:hypothetical protein
VGHQEKKMHIQSAREKEEKNGKREFSTPLRVFPIKEPEWRQK